VAIQGPGRLGIPTLALCRSRSKKDNEKDKVSTESVN
jgi:hypothetical protein